MKIKNFVTLLGFLAVVVAVGSLEVEAIGNRGVWVYPYEVYDPYAVMPTPASVAANINTKNVKVVYVNFSLLAAAENVWINWVRSLRTTLGYNNVEVYAMFGKPEWAYAGTNTTHPEYLAASNWANAMLALKMGTTPTNLRLFSGVMLDVEPAWLKTTSTNNDRLKWVQMCQQVKAAVALPANNPAGSPAAKFASVIQYWLNTLTVTISGVNKQLDRALMAEHHFTGIMSYREALTGDNGLYAIATAAVASSTATGKPIRLMVEAANSGEGDAVDFYGETEALVDSSLTAVLNNYASNALVAGIDVHHLAAWLALP